MTELRVFTNPEFGEVRTVELDGAYWFVGKDVAAALGYKEPTKATREKVEAEDRGVSKIDTPSGTQQMAIINESGLYSLILSSKLPDAKKFKRWVTSEVLPSLRKNGYYGIVTVPEEKALTPRCLTVDDYFKAASLVASCRNDRLSYVLYYLEQGGLPAPKGKDIADMSAVFGTADPNAPAKARKYLTDFKEKYGVTYEQLGKIIGLDRQRAHFYASGTRNMKPARAEMIIQRLTDAEAQLEEQAKS